MKGLPGWAKEFAFYSAGEEKLGLSSLEIKLLFLLWIFMFSPINTWVYRHVTLATPRHASAAWASAGRALFIQPGFRRGFSPDISLKHSHWAVVPHCGGKYGQRLRCCERLWLWQLRAPPLQGYLLHSVKEFCQHTLHVFIFSSLGNCKMGDST